MIFQRENCKPISAPTERQITRELSLTKSFGKSSFASLTDHNGSYVQAAGGPGIFMLEYRNASGVHHRAAQHVPVVPFQDGTLFSFSGGNIKLARGEWFQLKQVVQVFACYLSSAEFPNWLMWQPLDEGFIHDAQQSASCDRSKTRST